MIIGKAKKNEFFRKLNVSSRFLIWSLVLLAVSVSVSIFVVYEMNMAREHFNELTGELDELNHIFAFSHKVNQLVMPVNDYIILNGDKKEKERFEKMKVEANDYLKKLREFSMNSGEEMVFYRGVEENIKKINVASEDVFSVKESEFDLNRKYLGEKMEEVDRLGDEIIESHVGSWTNFAKEEVEEASADFEKSESAIRGAIVFMVVFFGFFVFIFTPLLSISIVRSVRDMLSVSRKISDGDMSVVADESAFGEFGELAVAFNAMIEKIKKSNREISAKVKKHTLEILKNQDRLKNQQLAIMNILEDVEDEKSKLFEEKERINTIIQGIGDGVFAINSDLEIILFGKMAEKISGFSSKEALGRKYYEVLEFVGEKDGKIYDDFIREPMTRGVLFKIPDGVMLKAKDGHLVPIGDSSAPIMDSNRKVVGCVVVFRDITKEKEIDRAKSEFVSLASHQLRTPLTAINWYIEMLMNGEAGKISDVQKDYLSEVYQGSTRMVNLVDSLLNTSRIDMGTFAVDPKLADIKEISDSVVDELKNKIEDRKLKIVKNYDKKVPSIKIDVNLVRIIFQNLLTNAVKYTPENGKIAIGISKSDKNILIEVADTGYGIPLDQQDRIFQKLFRADNVREKDTDGTGLGLYIIKSVLEKTGGKIWFRSKINKGTTFFVEIPLSGMKKKEGAKGLTFTE